MDIEELKQAWQAQTTRLDRLEQQNRELRLKLNENRIDSKRSKLLRTYTGLLWVSVLMIPAVIIAFPYLGLDWWATGAYVLGMAVLAVFNGVVYGMIRRLNLTDMTLQHALEHVLKIERTRRILRWIGMGVGAVVVVTFMYSLWIDGEHSAVIGGIVGGIAGGIVGLRKEREIKAIIRSMAADLRELMEDD